MTRVWDVGVRAFHWGLVLAVSVSAITGFVLGRTTLAWHLIAGVAVAAAIGWRVIWGVLGSTYARFASFAYAPAAVIGHLRDLGATSRHRFLGHNPLGAMMVFAMLVVLTAIVTTGTLVLGGLLKQGPLRSFLTYALGTRTLGIHNLLAIGLLVMIAAHLAGVAFESWRGRENLAAAMVSGRKPTAPPAEAATPVRSHPRIAMAIMVGGAVASVLGIAALSRRPGLGVPPQALDPNFELQCGACHLAFPPSLAPASTWTAITANLPHHFTADASLSPEQTAHIHDYLLANSAEHWDTLPAHVLRRPAADGSPRITDTPGWQRRHRAIAPAVFAAKPVYRRSACEACHADAATGLFAPQAIAIPSAQPGP